VSIDASLMRLHDWLGQYVLATVELTAEPGVALLAAEGVLHHWTHRPVELPSTWLARDLPTTDGGHMYSLVPEGESPPVPHSTVRLVVERTAVRSAHHDDREIRIVFHGGTTITVHRRELPR
jgi:hypothetical protein